MKRFVCTLLVIGGLASTALGQQVTLVLSTRAQVSLLTLAPGQALYSSFGHSALRIVDPASGLDKVYNFGTFDFNEPNFYLKFIRGKLLYRLSEGSFAGIVGEAQQQNRTLIEQILGLNQGQKQQLYTNLEKNLLPEHRYYRYDFYFDNCSTRIRDALESVCGEALQFPVRLERPLTFRQLLDPYLSAKPYADLGMDLGQGTPADHVATAYQSMFLPEYLMRAFDQATLRHENEVQPLVVARQALITATPTPLAEKKNTFPPILAMGLVGVLVGGITLWDYTRNGVSRWLDVLLFTITGILGVLLLFLWIGTDHQVTASNWNLLWAVPTHGLIVLFLRKKQRSTWVAFYFLISGLGVAFVLLAWPVLPQELDTDLVPLVAALGIRAFYLFYKQRERMSANKALIQV